jgi:hypothetical protein
VKRPKSTGNARPVPDQFKAEGDIMPPSREMDDRAIEALCSFLDRGESRWNGEPWSTILRRRLRNIYDAKLTGRTQWMYTHFHARWFIDRDDEKAASHVAKIWNVAKSTVLTHAKRRPRKAIALQWISLESRRAQQKAPNGYCPRDVDTYKMLDIVLTRMAENFSTDKKVKRQTAKAR